MHPSCNERTTRTPKPARSWRVTPAVGAIALVAALAGGAVAAHRHRLARPELARRRDRHRARRRATAPVNVSSTDDARSHRETTTRRRRRPATAALARGDLQGRRARRRLGDHDHAGRRRAGLGHRARHVRLHPHEPARRRGSAERARLVLEPRQRQGEGRSAPTRRPTSRCSGSTCRPRRCTRCRSATRRPSQVGDSVVAIGNPFGLDRTLTAGIISAVHREISAPNSFAIRDALQTDAAINHGNSGGPLIDRTGAVIGINAQLPSNSEVNGNVGVGFAIPIDVAKTVIPQLERHGPRRAPVARTRGRHDRRVPRAAPRTCRSTRAC